MRLDTATIVDGDRSLALKAGAGDLQAMESLCGCYLPVVYNRVRAQIPPEDVEDVVQEVFVAATRAITRYSAQASVKTWLCSIARRKVADFYRRRGRRVESVPLADHEINGGEIEERALIRVVLQRLPGHYREILFLRFAEGLRFHEIAGELGISVEAAKSRYRRAVQASRGMINA